MQSSNESSALRRPNFSLVSVNTRTALAARPPHPYASALFVDFMLSLSGQEIMAGQGRSVSRKDVNYLVDPGQNKLQVVFYENGMIERTSSFKRTIS